MFYDLFAWLGQQTALGVAWYFRQSDWVQILGLFAAIVVVVWWSFRTTETQCTIRLLCGDMAFVLLVLGLVLASILLHPDPDDYGQDW